MADEKISKSEANYRPGTSDRRCGNCSMFREPQSCTLVSGKIRAEDVCNYWERKRGKT